MSFNELNINDFQFDSLQEINKWALLGAGTEDNFNMMTITGFMYGKFFIKPMVQVYAHPTRHTYNFLENNDYFTVSFFKEPQHPALKICGQLSGKDVNKAETAELTPLPYNKTVLFEEAETVFICKKYYHTDVTKENFVSDEAFMQYYKSPGITEFHRIYIGQIDTILQRNSSEKAKS